eukprot:TRINITY_DN66476_c10_g16_i1.p2 TRINITY_DN66476_c10_g16~~TRINITY_DN66476_c10_g16_i1.p2  ORF type:complete len:147 (-),score=10.37 TRINITY_DN66476_c10_g16_i1:278-718(-)
MLQLKQASTTVVPGDPLRSENEGLVATICKLSTCAEVLDAIKRSSDIDQLDLTLGGISIQLRKDMQLPVEEYEQLSWKFPEETINPIGMVLESEDHLGLGVLFFLGEEVWGVAYSGWVYMLGDSWGNFLTRNVPVDGVLTSSWLNL